ncbi:MAG TPA: rRNA maturation RNase YbeY [Caulobacteraceae bacterium]
MIEIAITDRAWTRALGNARALTRRATRAAFADLAPGAAAAVRLTSDQAMSELNRRFRGKEGPTNVLAFPATSGVGGGLGDIAVAFGVCEREAAAQGKSLADHLQHLVVHGALHLIGYDHQNDGEAETMETIERRILARLGVADPYADRDGLESHVRTLG